MRMVMVAPCLYRVGPLDLSSTPDSAESRSGKLLSLVLSLRVPLSHFSPFEPAAVVPPVIVVVQGTDAFRIFRCSFCVGNSSIFSTTDHLLA